MSNAKSTKEEREDFIKKLEDEASELGLSLSEYLIKTGGDEMRDIMVRMIKAELTSSASVSADKF